MLDRYFGITAAGSTIRREVIAGATTFTFLTMAYIIFVNPQILSTAGMDESAVFVATCLAAVIGTLIMGLYAKYPIALAPGMGLNAFFAFVVVQGMGVAWEIALAAVFVSGILFFILSVLPVRAWIVNAIPHSQKMAIATGIGFFLAIIAFQNAGFITGHPVTMVTVGSLTSVPVLLAALGFFLIVALDAWRVPGAILIGILAITAIGVIFAVPYLDGKATTQFIGVVAMPPDPSPTLLKLDLPGLFQLGASVVFVIVFSFLLVDFFDTTGTLIGLAHQAKLLDSEGKLPRLQRALVADSSASMAGALLGTSTTTSYIESAAGIRAGGRTGLTAVVTAGFFLLALFFAPLAATIPPYATAPAILFVACMMARALASIDWDDATEYMPAIVTALAMPLTYSIATGIGFGFITYVLIKLLSGKPGDLRPAIVVVAAAFALHFWLG